MFQNKKKSITGTKRTHSQTQYHDTEKFCVEGEMILKIKKPPISLICDSALNFTAQSTQFCDITKAVLSALRLKLALP